MSPLFSESRIEVCGYAVKRGKVTIPAHPFAHGISASLHVIPALKKARTMGVVSGWSIQS